MSLGGKGWTSEGLDDEGRGSRRARSAAGAGRS